MWVSYLTQLSSGPSLLASVYWHDSLLANHIPSPNIVQAPKTKINFFDKVYNLVGNTPVVITHAGCPIYTKTLRLNSTSNHAGFPIKLSGVIRLTFMRQSGCGVRLCPVTTSSITTVVSNKAPSTNFLFNT